LTVVAWCKCQIALVARILEGLLHIQHTGLAVGLKTALTRTVNALGRKLKMLKEEQPNLSGDHIREGLGAIISVKVRRFKVSTWPL
jgi:DNA gyrase/topoisomerase IV subunit B